MTITITVEEEHEGQRLIADRIINAWEIDYANFDLVSSIVTELREKIEAQKKGETFSA